MLKKFIYLSKLGCKDQESIQSSTTPDPGSDKLTVNTTNESQEYSLFPSGDHKANITDAHKGIANTGQKNKSSTKEVPP